MQRYCRRFWRWGCYLQWKNREEIQEPDKKQKWILTEKEIIAEPKAEEAEQEDDNENVKEYREINKPERGEKTIVFQVENRNDIEAGKRRRKKPRHQTEKLQNRKIKNRKKRGKTGSRKNRRRMKIS